MAPPKRKTGGGRTTPKGTRPGDRVVQSNTESGDGTETARSVPIELREPNRFVPIIMIALLVLGVVIIAVRNLVFPSSGWLLLAGIGFILGGFIAATRWR